MGKPQSKPQLSLMASRQYDDWGGLPDSHWSYRFHEQVYCKLDDAEFADLYEDGGRQPVSPRLLVCITILQYIHRVSDREAVDRTIDSRAWRIALGIEPGWEGFHHTVLCYFRKRLLAHGEERRVFDVVLDRVRALGLLKGHTKVRVDATKLIANVAVLSRGDMIREAIRVVVCSLAKLAPKLRERRPEFARLYDAYHEEYWLGGRSDSSEDLRTLARDAQLALRLCGPYPVSGKETLAQILAENFTFVGEEPEPKLPEELAPGHIATPHEPDAEIGKEDDELWTGDKVHIVETVTEDGPGYVVDVLVTGPRVPDSNMTPEIVERVAEALPAVDTILDDSGYYSAANSVDAAGQGIDMISPPRQDTSKSALPASAFSYDFERQVARCPEGHESKSWRVGKRLRIKFSRPVCRACPRRAECTTSPTEPRMLTLSPHYEQLQKDRARALTPEFKELYAQRAGIEATISELVHRCGLRRSRYRTKPKRELHALLSVAALNMRRLLRAPAAENEPNQQAAGVLSRLRRALTRALEGLRMPRSAAWTAT